MLLDFEIIAMLVGVTLATAFSIIALQHTNVH